MQQPRSPVLGEAYAGPTTLNLRQELTPKSPVSATVKHGERLDVLEYKRRFVKVRTSQGAEGWTDNRQLLSPEQMNALKTLAEQSARFPSQGAATVYESLNMHTEPSRGSPSFVQIAQGSKVDVIGHKITPRTQAVKASGAPPPKPKPVRRRGKEKMGAKIAPPPMPPAPKPPENWLELSGTSEEEAEAKDTNEKAAQQAAAQDVPMDDWSQVRTRDGKVGWVLSRLLLMAIPDDVAQYAEGHRITSYFALGEVHDDMVKKHWLWTTIGKGVEPYEFDSFRVFTWNRRRHRYETAFIERNVVGHFPVQVNSSGENATFSVVVEGTDGGLYKKSYSFQENRVRFLTREPYHPAVEPSKPTAASAEPSKPQEPKSKSWRARLRGLFGK
jgi:hypothetical protein